MDYPTEQRLLTRAAKPAPEAEASRRPQPEALLAKAALAFPLVALFVWVLALRQVNIADMTEFGLLSVLPALFYAALGLLVVSFAISLWIATPRSPLLLFHTLAFILIIHGTPSVLYGTLRYSWAWKHVGIVDFIQRHGAVDPGVNTLNVYHMWPGFFALSAFLTEAAGLGNALPIAIWAPLFFNVLNLGAVWLIAGALTSDRRLQWAAIWLFFLANWVGQDYFSPQAFSFFLYLTVLGVALRWFRPASQPSIAAIHRLVRFGAASMLIHRLLAQASASEPPPPALRREQRAGLYLLAVSILALIAVSHQLTPLMGIVALGGLAVFCRLSAPSLPALLIIFTALWMGFMATPFVKENLADVIGELGSLGGNSASTLQDISNAGQGQLYVSFFSRGLSLSFLVLAAIGAARRMLQRRFDFSALLLLAAPFALLGGSAYGGEIGFRVYLFATPFLAFFAAASLWPNPQAAAPSRAGFVKSATAMTVLSGALLLAFLFAYYGKENQYHFTRGEVEAARYLYGVAPDNSKLIEGSTNYPSRFMNYERFHYVDISAEPRESRERVLENPADRLYQWMDDSDYVATYLIITRSQKALVNETGQLPRGALQRIEDELERSPRFKTLYANEDATIFALDEGAGDGS